MACIVQNLLINIHETHKSVHFSVFCFYEQSNFIASVAGLSLISGLEGLQVIMYYVLSALTIICTEYITGE